VKLPSSPNALTELAPKRKRNKKKIIMEIEPRSDAAPKHQEPPPFILFLLIFLQVFRLILHRNPINCSSPDRKNFPFTGLRKCEKPFLRRKRRVFQHWAP
jgi:hypothetical protein